MTDKYIYLDKLCGSSYDHAFTPELVNAMVETFDRYSKQNDCEKELSMVAGLIPLTDEEVIFNQEYMAGFPLQITELAEAYRGRTQPNNRAYIDSDPYLLTGGAVILYLKLKEITQFERISGATAKAIHAEIFSDKKQLDTFEKMIKLNFPALLADFKEELAQADVGLRLFIRHADKKKEGPSGGPKF